jgi:hypothetical protein
MNGTAAANDLVKKLYDVASAIQGLEGDFVVPIIMDGENAWESFPRDGKEFLNSFYSQVSEASWLAPVTISDCFARLGAKPLDRLAPGSWIAPNFNTWIGESEENAAWDYLAAARSEVDKLPALSAQTKQAALTELYAAEGSDWFWWYGLDQGSGNDEAFDAAFRGTLERAYALLGEKPPQYLAVPIVGPPACSPDVSITGTISPTLDGSLGEPPEWDRAAHADDMPLEIGEGGLDVLRGLYYGYDAENLWLGIETGAPFDSLALQGCGISVYFSGKSDLAVQAYAEVQPGGPGHAFDFGITSKLDVLIDRAGASAVFSNSDGEGGWVRAASLPLEGEKFVEVAVPFALLELASGEELKFGLVGYCGGVEQDLLPDQGFFAFKVPPLGGVSYLKTMEDPRDDDHGPGSYVYPTDPVFGDGAFDIRSVEVMLDPEANMIMRVSIGGAIACPWGGATGYSLQAIDVYIDTDGIPDSGRRDLYDARKARTTPESAWEYFVRASMDTVAMYDAGGRRLNSVKVISYADAATQSIFIKFPVASLGAAEDLRMIVAMLGHDGYAEGGIRPVKALPAQWVFGGCDQEALCPNIIDLVVPEGASQENILGSYRATGKLSEIPGRELVLP